MNFRLSEADLAELDRRAAAAACNRGELIRRWLANEALPPEARGPAPLAFPELGKPGPSPSPGPVPNERAARGRERAPGTVGGRCPQCGGITMASGKGNRECRMTGCGWKGAV